MTYPNALSLPPTAWRSQKSEAPLGGLAPMGVHAIDGMIDLAGEIDQVYCQSFARFVENGTDDTTSMLFRMKAGMSGYLGTMTTTGAGFSFQVFGTKGWQRLEGVTHVAGAPSEERRTRQFGVCKFQPVKGPLETWDAEKLDIVRATFESFARAAARRAALPDSAGADGPRRVGHRSDDPLGGEWQGRKSRLSLRMEDINGSRQRPRPPDLFDAGASRRHLGRHVDSPDHLRAAGAEARLPHRAVRRVAAAVEASATTLVRATRRARQAEEAFSPTTTCTSTRSTRSPTGRSRTRS